MHGIRLMAAGTVAMGSAVTSYAAPGTTDLSSGNTMTRPPIDVRHIEGPTPSLVKFTDQTVAAGLAFTHSSAVPNQTEPNLMAGGAAIADLNRDGALDIIVQGGLGQNAKLFMNNGNGQFVDEALFWGINLTNVEGSNIAVADVDYNGYLDLYVGTLHERNYLYSNTGFGFFVETGASSGGMTTVGDEWFNSFGTAFGDLDEDGDLDLITAHWTTTQPALGNRVFINDGNGIFQDVTDALGVFQEPGIYFGFSPAIIDLNGDRLPEIAVAADFGTSRYYRNMGAGGFSRLKNGTCTDENGMGSALGDYDNDGDLDWFVTSISDTDGVSETGWGITGNRLYRNDGNDQYTDVTDDAGVRDGGWGWGTTFGDFNNDGLLDLGMTNGYSLFGVNPDVTFLTDPTRLWIHTGTYGGGESNPTYRDVAPQAGIDHTGDGRSMLSFDADADGDLDILITTNQGAMQYYRNETNPTPDRWLQIDLSPSGGGLPPDGIGSVIELSIDGTTYRQSVYTKPSFMGQDPLRTHFGFPETDIIDSVTVTWANGTTTVLTDVAPGQIMTITP